MLVGLVMVGLYRILIGGALQKRVRFDLRIEPPLGLYRIVFDDETLGYGDLSQLRLSRISHRWRNQNGTRCGGPDKKAESPKKMEARKAPPCVEAVGACKYNGRRM